LVDPADINADLPDWPDDVVDQWLLKLANRGPDTGWPPPNVLDGHAWKYILGGRPLSWWKQVSWKLEEHELKFESLSCGARRIVSGMIDGHINDVPNIFSAGPDSKRRFVAVGRYVAQHGTFPRPLVVMRLEDGLSVLDGNHRMTALCACQGASEQIVKSGGAAPLKSHRLWMGTHADGEVPL
jgi:hypothetical protein